MESGKKESEPVDAPPLPLDTTEKDASAAGDSPLNEVVSRRNICCDAPNCNEYNPPLACPDCDAAYFCGEECRAQDAANEHGHTCYNDAALKEKFENGKFNSFATDAGNVKAAKNDDCAICLAEEVVEPIVLTQCKHKFCSACLKSWCKSSASCPTCRQEMLSEIELEEKLIDLLSLREITCTSEEERKKVRSCVRKRIDDTIERHDRTVPLVLTLAKHVAKDGNIEETKRLISEVWEMEGIENYADFTASDLQGELQTGYSFLIALGLGEDHANHSIQGDLAMKAFRMFSTTNAILGEANRCHGNHLQARECFEEVLQVNNTCHANRRIQWQLAESYYETGEFRKSTESAQKALHWGSREKGNVHKCRALSHLALGESAAAVQAFHLGVLHSLDNGDRASVYKIYREYVDSAATVDPRSSGPALRFAVGEAVDCRVSDETWRRGKIKQVWWQQNDDECIDWPRYAWVPYQIVLHDEVSKGEDDNDESDLIIYSPVDSDETIRRVPRFEVGQRVQAMVSGEWADATITQVWPPWREMRGLFEDGVISPYKITLDDGSVVYAPDDEEYTVRLRPGE
mmetsp:Transcript_23486/g.67681  ORF Transcript_23486/g.67681 Transcript_23486/m.67681 type:complete len:575 (+) Transcript_23486:330-2054(+)